MSDFEITFGPELASFAFPQHQTRSSTPSPSWAIQMHERERIASPYLPHSSAITSITATATSITPSSGRQTPSHSRALSFLKRNPTEPLKEKLNGTSISTARTARTRGLSETGSGLSRSHDHQREKENARVSRFQGEYTVAPSENGSVAQTTTNGGAGTLKRMGTDASARTESIGSRVGSVRKRLSMLKLGKKTSRSGVCVDRVAEE